MGQTRFDEFPGTARELIDITAHGDWDEVGEKVDFKRGQPAFDSLAGPAGVKRAQDYAVKYLGVEASKNKAPGTDQQGVAENFADGKVKGKSRPGRVKRAGASCAGSVTDLRARAKKYSGERGKMYHWCANMKGGKKK